MSEGAAKHLVFVGLGNPGVEYSMTRHNIGYLVIQTFAHAFGWTFKDEKSFSAQVAKGKVGDITVHLLLPTTYMNESGRALRSYLDFYKLSHDNMCVVTDDVHLPFGQMRLRRIGSAGGHNGLKSIEAHLRSQHYLRLRMGVGREHQREKTLADYVLDNFTLEESQKLADFLVDGVKVLRRLVSEDVSAVMATVNRIGEQ